MNSARYPTNCVERFLEYVKIDTQSCEDSETYPRLIPSPARILKPTRAPPDNWTC
jgi:hypothetical protein